MIAGFLKKCLIRHDIRHLRLTACYGAGLIKSHNLCAACCLKACRCLEEYTALCALAISYHYRNRSCQSKCTRTAYHEHRNASGKRKAHGLTGYKPCYYCNDCNCNNRRHKYSRYPVSDFCNRRLCRCGIRNHLYDL